MNSCVIEILFLTVLSLCDFVNILELEEKVLVGGDGTIKFPNHNLECGILIKKKSSVSNCQVVVGN